MKKRKASGITHFDPRLVDQTRTRYFETYLLQRGLEIDGYRTDLTPKAPYCVQTGVKAGACL